RDRLMTAAAQSESARQTAVTAQKEAQAKLDKQAADLAALEHRTKPLLEKAGSAGAAREGAARLTADLKKLLAADKDITVESSDDRVVLSLAQKALFNGDDGEPGMDGYRVLFRMGKALKATAKDVKDRQAV